VTEQLFRKIVAARNLKLFSKAPAASYPMEENERALLARRLPARAAFREQTLTPKRPS